MDKATKAPTRMGVRELFSTLIGLGYTEKDLLDNDGKKLKRPQLLEKLQSHISGDQSLDMLETVDEADDIGIELEQDAQPSEDADKETEDIDAANCDSTDPPNPSDPGWTQYVLGQFLEDEVDGKNPRVEGLRRVAGNLVGEIIEEGCDLVATPCEKNRFRACVKAWVVFLKDDGTTRRFEALADAHSENCLEDYATYLVAMADTRAKGRAYRIALCLRRVVAAEEINKTEAHVQDTKVGGPIHTSQITMLRILSDRQKMSIPEVLDSIGIEYKMNDATGDVDLSCLTYEQALLTAKKIRETMAEKGDS